MKEKERKIKIVYFAHPTSHYDTPLESDCLEYLYSAFGIFEALDNDTVFEIFNPNQPITQKVYQRRKDSNHPDRFEFFRELARASDYLVMTSFLDGCIGAGVAEEGKVTLDQGKVVFLLSFIEIDGNIIKCLRQVKSLSGLKILSIEETVDRIKDGIQ